MRQREIVWYREDRRQVMVVRLHLMWLAVDDHLGLDAAGGEGVVRRALMTRQTHDMDEGHQNRRVIHS